MDSLPWHEGSFCCICLYSGVREPPVTGQVPFPSSVPCKPISHPRTNKYSFHNRSALNYCQVLWWRLYSPTSIWGIRDIYEIMIYLLVFFLFDHCFRNRKCPTPGCDGSGHVTGRFTAHHCISGCPLAERNQGRLKADLSDSECKRNLFFGQRTKKTHYRGR